MKTIQYDKSQKDAAQYLVSLLSFTGREGIGIPIPPADVRDMALDDAGQAHKSPKSLHWRLMGKREAKEILTNP